VINVRPGNRAVPEARLLGRKSIFVEGYGTKIGNLFLADASALSQKKAIEIATTNMNPFVTVY
jgi:hypothetical protein